MHPMYRRILTVLTLTVPLTALGGEVFTPEGTGMMDCRYTATHKSPTDEAFGNHVTGTGLWDDGQAITVFVDDAFAAKMASCSDGSDPAFGVTQEELESVARDGLEVWNRQSKSRALLWGGDATLTLTAPSGSSTKGLSVNADATLCADIQSRSSGPAVFIYPSTNVAAKGGAQGFKDCQGVTAIRIGLMEATSTVTDNPYDLCTVADRADSGNDPKDWMVDNSLYGDATGAGYEWGMQSVFAHELGHRLGLAHRHANPATDTQDTISLMSYGKPGDEGAQGVYLFDWDRDCVDDTSGTAINERTVEMRHAVFSSAGLVAQVKSPSTPRVKAGRQGGRVFDVDGGVRYALHRGDEIRLSGKVKSGTNFLNSAWTTDVALDSVPDFFEPYVAPVVYAAEEFFAEGETARMNYLDIPSCSDLVGPCDPSLGDLQPLSAFPSAARVAIDTSEGWFAAGTGYEDVAVEFSSGAPVTSDIPLQTTFDPRSGRTIVLRVRTDRTESTTIDAALGNKMELYVLDDSEGLHLVGSLSTDEGNPVNDLTTILLSEPNIPAVSSRPWTYDMRTNVQPGLACTDDSEWTFNCMIAWKDTGSPYGNILVADFRIDPATMGAIVNGVYPLNTSDTCSNCTPEENWFAMSAHTNSDVAAGFLNSRFFVAWKDENMDIRYVRSSQFGTFQFPTTDPTQSLGVYSDVVGGPSFAFDPVNDGKGAVLSWTVDGSIY